MRSDSAQQPDDRPARHCCGQRRALAAAASLLLGPGAGHLARGRPRRAALWLALVLASVLLVPWLGLRALLLTLTLHLVAAVDAGLAPPAARGLPGWGRTLRFWAAFTAVAALAVFGLRRFVVDTFRVPGPSMEPTLSIGDVFVLNKLLRRIEVGDAIVYRSPTRADRLFVHRVVATGGDTVQIDGNVVYVNRKPLAKQPVPGPCRYLDDQRGPKGDITWQEVPCQQYEERVGSRAYRLVHGERPGQLADVAEVKIPADAYYVLGDNRDSSNDSRAWGPVTIPNVVGRVDAVVWSRGRDGVRWNRIGQAIR